MSARKLGGGRILGNGKGPRDPISPTSAFVPSEDSNSPSSTKSWPSSAASRSLKLFEQGLDASIILADPSKPAAPLACPICAEEMVCTSTPTPTTQSFRAYVRAYLQNGAPVPGAEANGSIRHLDDIHQELPEIAQDEVKSWFDKQVLKAKRFQPFSLINQKLRGLDPFESNANTTRPSGPAQNSAAEAVDPDEMISRTHWQRQTASDRCTDPACQKRLGTMNGCIHCRKCGRLFCDEHTLYQMRLSRTAKHEPVMGYWARVCETCYKSRDGYNDHAGLEIDLTKEFAAIRDKKIERLNLNTARLQRRLARLTMLLVDYPDELTPGPMASFLTPVSTLTGSRSAKRAIEQSVVAWEDDGSVATCPFCRQEFSSWVLRRHHCRICGRIVCADAVTKCSSELALDPSQGSRVEPEKVVNLAPSAILVRVRMCRDCSHAIFSRKEFDDSVKTKPPDQRAYETLHQFQTGISQLMPNFQKALLALQNNNAHSGRTLSPNGPTSLQGQVQQASRMRKRLIDSFTKLDAAARRIRDLQTDSSTQKRMQDAVHSATSAFLHANMIPLKNIPQTLKTVRQSSDAYRSSPLRNGKVVSHLADADAVSEASEASTVLSGIEAEERDLKERLIVLEEQRYLIGNMISTARGASRFEEVSALARNVDELDAEIDKLKLLVGQVEEKWESSVAAGEAG